MADSNKRYISVQQKDGNSYQAVKLKMSSKSIGSVRSSSGMVMILNMVSLLYTRGFSPGNDIGIMDRTENNGLSFYNNGLTEANPKGVSKYMEESY